MSPREPQQDGAEIKAAWDAAQESGYDLKELLIGGSPLDLEDQLDLVDQVMMDRSIISRPRPSQTTPAGAGSPPKMPTSKTWMTLWRYRATNRRYLRGTTPIRWIVWKRMGKLC